MQSVYLSSLEISMETWHSEYIGQLTTHQNVLQLTIVQLDYRG